MLSCFHAPMFSHPSVVTTIEINFLKKNGEKKTEFNIKNSKYLDWLSPVYQCSLVDLGGNVKNLLIGMTKS